MDKQQAEICETYQLKWGSFSSYMHSCISSSLYGDTFADVALVTADGHQIMAHRYVLSYSSLFLAHVLKLHRKVTTALPLMVVMPPEIDHKSLKVLVRYMYSGEAKVSKEILKNVLRGGDILQIKGLYREKENEDKNVKITQQPHKTTATIPSASPASPAVPPMIPIVKPAIKATPTATQTSKSSENNPKSPQKTAPQKFLLVQKQKEQVVTYANARQKAKVLNFTLMHSFDKTGQSPITEGPEKRVTILNKQLDPLAITTLTTTRSKPNHPVYNIS
ncbi:hypothetical protein JTB14_017704 [Gonioctena quinquepunctata]|nr:hypothetical protein JTB14_017704 [Gonioctena quinquepunctata]